MIGYAGSLCRAPGCLGPDGLPRPAARWLCSECDALTKAVVVEAGVLYLAVREQLHPGSNGGERPGQTGTASRPPLRVDMLDLANESLGLFIQWARIVGGPPAGSLAASLAVLIEWHEHIVGSEYAPAYANDLRRWSIKVKSMTGLESRPVRVPAACPVCDLRGLQWFPSQRELRCRACGSRGAQLLSRELAALVEGARIPSA